MGYIQDTGSTESRCGNGVVEPGEVCDDGNIADDFLCSANCRAMCGDGICHPEEYACPADCGVSVVAAGYRHTCTTMGTGSVYCWGDGEEGQLGNGLNDDQHAPTTVVDISDARVTERAIAAGFNHNCAVLQDGEVWCWGENTKGALGDGTLTSSSFPVRASGVSHAREVTAGKWHSCALLEGGVVWCWGGNEAGQVSGSADAVMTPTPVAALPTAIRVEAGGTHTCAIVEDGRIYCWGQNSYGELGRGSTNLSANPEPMAIDGLAGATDLAGGSHHTCAAVDTGQVYCWGMNTNGELGNATTTDNPSPGPTTTVGFAVQVGARAVGHHSCALTDDAGVFCWGFGEYGQLGQFLEMSDIPLPVPLPGIAMQLTVGSGHNCAILDDAELVCWGNNDNGQLGDGTTDNSATAVSPRAP